MLKNDFTNKIVNGMLVKERDFSNSSKKDVYWICVCPICKKDFSVRSNHLTDKKKPTSKCAKCNREQREDLTGQIFHYLRVDKMIYPEKYKRTKCSCTCLLCGATNVVVQANHLKSGETKSCGCLKSYGEKKIAELLIKNNVKFEREKKFPDLKYTNILRCDFYLPDFNLIIEYNGEQHYKAVKLYGGEENLKITQTRDEIKRKYCEDNNINYLVIRYDENIEEVLIKNNII